MPSKLDCIIREHDNPRRQNFYPVLAKHFYVVLSLWFVVSHRIALYRFVNVIRHVM